MTEIHIPCGRDGYHEVLRHVLTTGKQRSPRGLKTIDAGHTTMVLTSPFDALPLHTNRGVSLRIVAAEAVQLIGGFSDPKLLPASFDRFKEDDGRFWGAYGVRIGNQLSNAVRKLQSDHDSRQAIITLWDPTLDNVEPAKRDHPCTVALGFALVDDKLSLHVTMRSSDVWLGIPYDWGQFTQLQLSIAALLDIEPGQYWHTSWSLHLYDEHAERAYEVGPSTGRAYQPTGIGNDTVRDVQALQTRALAIANGQNLIAPTKSERWYVNALSA